MSGYDNIKMSWIAYLAVLGSEGNSIYDMAYYPCPVYDNNVGIWHFNHILIFGSIFSKYGAIIPKQDITLFRYDSAMLKSKITSM